MLAVPLYVLAIRYLSNAESVLLSPFLFVYCILTMVGSLFPDVDWAIMKVYRGFGHRNPITHSIIIPALVSLIALYYGVTDLILLPSLNAFVFGVAAHLFGDVVRTGNLVWIRTRKYESLWYLSNGVVVVIILGLIGFFRSFQFWLI